MLEENKTANLAIFATDLLGEKINSKYYDWTVKIKAQDSRFKVQTSKFICGQSSFIKGVKRAQKCIA